MAEQPKLMIEPFDAASSADPEAHEAVAAFLAAYPANTYPTPKFADLPGGPRLARKDADWNRRCALAAADQAGHWLRQHGRIGEAMAVHGQGSVADYTQTPGAPAYARLRAVEAMLALLLRRTLPLDAADVATLARAAVPDREEHGHITGVPAGAVAKQAEDLLKRGPIDDDEARAALLALRHWIAPHKYSDGPKIAARIDKALGGGAGAAEGEGIQIAADVPPPAAVGTPGVLVALKQRLGLLPADDAPSEAVGPDAFPLRADSPLAEQHAAIGEALRQWHAADNAMTAAWHAISAGESHASRDSVRKESDAAQRRAVASLKPQHAANRAKLARALFERAAAQGSAMDDYRSHRGIHEMAGEYAPTATLIDRDANFDVLLYESAFATHDAAVNPWMAEIAETHAKMSELTPGERHVVHRLRCLECEVPPMGVLPPTADRLTKLIEGEGHTLLLVPGEHWSDAVHADLAAMKDKPRAAWAELLRHAVTAEASKPAAKWAKAAGPLVKAVKPAAFRERAGAWLSLFGRGRSVPLLGWAYQNDRAVNETPNDGNATVARGLVWMLAGVSDESTPRVISDLLLTSIRKTPGVGPRCVKVANACVWALGEMAAGKDEATRDAALGQLARLKARVTFRTTLKAIEKALDKAAAKAGVAKEDLEELGVPSFGFEAGAPEPKAEPPADAEAARRALADLGLTGDDGWLAALPAAVARRPNPWLALAAHLTADRVEDMAGLHDAAEIALLHDENRPAPGSDAFAQRLAAAGPSPAWFDRVETLVEEVGREQFAADVAALVGSVSQSPPGRLNRPGVLRDALRPLLWLATLHGGSATIERLTRLARWSNDHRTVQARTLALALAYACTPESAAALRRLEDGSRRPSPKRRFGGLAEHVEARLGLDPDDVRERHVGDAGFNATSTTAVRRVRLGGATAEQRVEGNKVVTAWTSAQGKPLKSPPAAVKRQFKEELKELKQAAKDAEGVLLAGRDRLDNLYLTGKSWRLGDFRERYLNHGLLGPLARRLVWDVDGAVVRFDGDLATDADGKAVEFGGTAEVRLWHPIGAGTEAVLAWRDRLAAERVTQPFKQAHREVYLLTDAERRTGTYSNRFAAHVVRQHQFNALCAARGWRNQLRLMVDDSYEPPRRDLPSHGLRAEFWVEGIGDDYSTDTTESGSYLRLATDQVRFYQVGAAKNYQHASGGRYDTYGTADEADNHPLPLDQIPPLVLSEILRDCDLFVGVASVGNDPTWQDGGPDGRFRDYWQSYSFGDLSQTAKTRKAVLERLVPRLKIAERCSFSDKFLVVRGDRRTYKIHLGSGNILMEPDDQYLCIVPDRRAEDPAGSPFLPFEGDRTLSVVVSKALLLAADAGIKDPTIVSQIGRR